jgi:hypothetical protein
MSRGRSGGLPLPSEFDRYSAFASALSGRVARIERLVVLGLLTSPDAVSRPGTAKRNEILTYFAMLRSCAECALRAFGCCRPETQADIKLLWPSYKSAMEEGDTNSSFSLA